MNNFKYYEDVGLTLLYGDKMHPGSGHVKEHQKEINIFNKVLESITDEKNPVMFEIGGFWSLWSLMFKKKFKNGKSVIIELGKRQLEVGKKNFDLNNLEAKFYHGGFFINSSQTFADRSWVLEYDKAPEEDVVGKELDFFEIYKKEKIDNISILHMDIQGSELDLISSLDNLFKEKKIRCVIIGTHSSHIHETIESNLLKNEYLLKTNIPYNGNDGLIVASII